jgi:signal peptide peptidase SppA
MTKQLAHLATRIFGKPLAMEPRGMDVILSVLAPRLNLAEPPVATAEQMSRRRENKPYAVTDDGIAVIDIVGPLVNRASGDTLSGGPTTYSEIAEEVLDAGTDPQIKGIVLEVDSPGGEVGGLFDLCDLLSEVSKSKPVYGSASEDAFSAAYAIISCCDRIFLTQTGGLGSIGVIALHCDQSGLDSSVGLKYTAIYAGSHKNDFSPHEPLSQDAKDWLQGQINDTYSKFSAMVSSNRDMTDQAVRGTQARVFFGQKAITAGLGDQIGTLQDAIAAMSDRIAGKTSYTQQRASAPRFQTLAPTVTAPAIKKMYGLALETTARSGETKEAAFTRLLTNDPKAYEAFRISHAKNAAMALAGLISPAEALEI